MNGDIIAAQQFEGELYIKASDHHRIVKAAVEAEREECAKYFEDSDYMMYRSEVAAAIRARGQS